MITEPVSSWDLNVGDRVFFDGHYREVINTRAAGLDDWIVLVCLDDWRGGERRINKGAVPVLDREVSA